MVIAKRGLVKKAIAKSAGTYKSGMTFFAEGSVRSELLKLLGLDRSSKEVAIIPLPETQVDAAFQYFETELSLTAKNTGIAFAVPLKSLQDSIAHVDTAKKQEFPFHCITVIVDKGKSAACVNAALRAKASGGTILQAHGAGVPKDFYFPLAIEPQKDVVLIVAETSMLPSIQQAIIDDMHLTEPVAGILLALPISKAIGLPTHKERASRNLARMEK